MSTLRDTDDTSFLRFYARTVINKKLDNFWRMDDLDPKHSHKRNDRRGTLSIKRH